MQGELPTGDQRSHAVGVFEWRDGRRTWRVPYDDRGSGPPLVCLPAPSTISTRAELDTLATRLSSRRRVLSLDLPGFGEADRFPTVYRPDLLMRFVNDFVAPLAPVDVLAAGHSASYVLAIARPGLFRRVALLAPTWRGPLPTAMGQRPRTWAALESLVQAALVGAALYAANASRRFIGWMMRRHVYADPARITDALLESRWRVAHRRNARFAAAAFVTGGLDAFASRDELLAAARACPAPLFVAIGAGTPPRSRAEMDALAALPGVASAVLPGSLALHDEHPDFVAAAVERFLG